VNRIIEDIQEQVNELKAKLGEPGLKLTYSASRGYHLEMPATLLSRTSLQTSSFVQVHKKAKKAYASTEGLLSLNAQLRSTLDEVSALSYSVMAGLLELARERISCLYNITYVVASLDMLLAFACYASSFPSVRPVFSDRLLLKEARSPLIEALKKRQSVANDVEMTEVSRLHILTGPNASGKSTLLVTVGQLVVLAHAGSFVPATSASLPRLKNMFLRAGETESLEEGTSGFMSEMKEMAYILANAGPDSLILVDEMCRGTFSEDANSLAWTLCEAFLVKKSLTCVATHLQTLTSMENLYLPIRNYHTLEYKLKSGPSPRPHGYGLSLAGQTALPEALLAEAASVLQTLVQTTVRQRPDLHKHKVR
jgi:DNA mismatch repair protein MSH4